MEGGWLSSISVLRKFRDKIVFMQWGKTATIVGSVGLGTCLVITNSLKGLFVYYIRFKAPKGRHINEMMSFDQVIFYFLLGP